MAADKVSMLYKLKYIFRYTFAMFLAQQQAWETFSGDLCEMGYFTEYLAHVRIDCTRPFSKHRGPRNEASARPAYELSAHA